MNTTPSNIFYILLLLERYHQHCQADLDAKDMNALTLMLVADNLPKIN